MRSSHFRCILKMLAVIYMMYSHFRYTFHCVLSGIRVELFSTGDPRGETESTSFDIGEVTSEVSVGESQKGWLCIASARATVSYKGEDLPPLLTWQGPSPPNAASLSDDAEICPALRADFAFGAAESHLRGSVARLHVRSTPAALRSISFTFDELLRCMTAVAPGNLLPDDPWIPLRQAREASRSCIAAQNMYVPVTYVSHPLRSRCCYSLSSVRCPHLLHLHAQARFFSEQLECD